MPILGRFVPQLPRHVKGKEAVRSHYSARKLGSYLLGLSVAVRSMSLMPAFAADPHAEAKASANLPAKSIASASYTPEADI